MIKVFLDNVEITNNAEIDFSYVEKLDRELDEGFIVISHVNEPNQYPMFSVIDIYENSTLLFSGRISRDNVELSSFSNSIYNHNISLIEHTKLLEKFLVNGKTFTQPIRNQTYSPYTLFDVVDILRKTAVFEKTGFEEFFAPFVIPQSLENELKEIIAPEFTFKDLTLRQALDEVGNYINAISRLDRDKNLIFDKFNELLSPINEITESYKKEQNINGYSTYLSSDAINPINNAQSLGNYNNFEYYPSKSLWTTLRSEFGQFDFTNSVIPTPKPIYDVMGLETVIQLEVVRETGFYDGSNYVVQNTTTEIDSDFYVLDITDNVVEKKEYDILEELTGGWQKDLNKRNAIFFNYGKKGISMGQTFGVFDIQQSFPLVIQSALIKNIVESYMPISETGTYSFQGELSSGYFEFWGVGDNEDTRILIKYNLVGNIDEFISFSRWKTLFRVKYIPLPPSIRYEVVRDDLTEVNLFTYNTINQKMRMVDLQSFADNMKGRINQLGEGMLQLSHKVKSIDFSWRVGDFTQDNFVITKKEVIAQRDHYIINYELNRNFNKISQFLGIDQEIRQWEIGESGRTLDRDLNYNEFIEVYSTNDGTFTYDAGQVTIKNNALFLDTFDNSVETEPMDFGVFNAEGVLEDEQGPYSLLLPIYKLSGGDAFGFYFDFESNASAANELEEGDSSYAINLLESVAESVFGTGSFGRYYNVPVKYTGQVGRLPNFNISIYNADLTIGNPDFETEAQDANSLPKFSKSISEDSIISSDFYAEKDNRERLKFTMLYQILSKDLNDVIIGERLSTHNSFVTTDKKNIELRAFNDRKFTNRNKFVKLDDFDYKSTQNFLTINDSNSYIEVTDDISSYSSWALTDDEGYPYIMVNSNNPRVVFEFNNKRSGIDYGLEDLPNFLRRPNVIEEVVGSEELSFKLGNPNDEDVNIEVALGQEVKTLEVPANSVSGLFTFDQLEPNLNYSFSAKCLPLQGSTNLESSTRTFSNKTDIIPLNPPIASYTTATVSGSIDQEIIDGQVVIYPNGKSTYDVRFSIINNNPFQVRVSASVNSSFVTEIQDEEFLVDANSTGEFIFTKKFSEPPGETDYQVATSETRFVTETPYEVYFVFITNEFTNNWLSPQSSTQTFTINLPPIDEPTINWVPTSSEGTIIFDVTNDANYDIDYSAEYRLNDQLFFGPESGTLTANSTTRFQRTNLSPPEHNANPSDDYRLRLDLQANQRVDRTVTSELGRIACEAKPPTITFISKRSTNNESFMTFRLKNNERYTADVYYSLLKSNEAPLTFNKSVSLGAGSSTTFELPSSGDPSLDVNDQYRLWAYTDQPSITSAAPEVIDVSQTVSTDLITPEPYIDQFTVRFLDIDGNEISSVLKDDGTQLQIGDFPSAPQESGYDFIDWYDSAQLNNIVSTGYTITDNLDVYPRYDLITYTITYELDGSTNDPSNPSTYTIEDTPITLQDASRTGYEFDGWYSDSLFTAQVTEIPQGNTGNITLYAKLNRLFLEDVVVQTTVSTTSITVNLTNPSNQRSDANVRFWLGLKQGSTIISTQTLYELGSPGATREIVFDNLDDNVTYTLYGPGTNDNLVTVDVNNIYDDEEQPSINVTTDEIVGNRILEVILNTQALGSTSGTFNYNVNGVPQSGVTVNNSSYTTVRSNLFDTDVVELFAPSLSGFSFSNYIINGTQVNDQSPEVTVGTGLTVEIVYT